MARPNLEKYLDLLEQSGLVGRDQLSRVLDELTATAGDKPIADPELIGQKLVAAGLLTEWQSQKLLEGRHKGFFLKRYKLLDHLGTGGMSQVYLAEHVLMQRRVAIKVLPKHRVDDSSYLERFHRESQAAAALDHRNIVRAYDVDNEGDIHFLVMEYVEGRDLQVMVREDGPLPYAAAADYMRQAALGLDHAHKAGLIHRDVKPANLLVDLNKVLKVLDLGLARFTGDERASLTVAYDENVLGTADYLAPEQALDSHGVDARADIYSLGCSLYFLLTGRPPFAEGTLPQRLMMHQKHPPPSIRQVRPDAPSDLVHICLRMMAKQPQDRYQSAAELADVLADWLAAHGHSFDSGGGSSGRLAAAAAPAREWVRARRIETADDLPGSSGKGSSIIRRAEGSDLVKVEPADESDTVTGQGHPTTAGPESGVRRAADRPDSGVEKLPKARPLEEAPAAPQFVIHVESPAVERLKTGRTMTREEYEAYRLKRKQVPIWVWGLIGGGSVLAVILFILLLLSRF